VSDCSRLSSSGSRSTVAHPSAVAMPRRVSTFTLSSPPSMVDKPAWLNPARLASSICVILRALRLVRMLSAMVMFSAGYVLRSGFRPCPVSLVPYGWPALPARASSAGVVGQPNLGCFQPGYLGCRPLPAPSRGDAQRVQLAGHAT